MKIRKSFAVDEDIWRDFDDICGKAEKDWETTMSRSQLIESMIVGWTKKNKNDIL